jgi:ABC-type glutathione transport system ATPase component
MATKQATHLEDEPRAAQGLAAGATHGAAKPGSLSEGGRQRHCIAQHVRAH